MVSIVATVTEQDVSRIVICTTSLAALNSLVIDSNTCMMGSLTSPGRSSAERTRGLVLPGVDWRGCVICDPATVGASASQTVSQ